MPLSKKLAAVAATAMTAAAAGGPLVAGATAEVVPTQGCTKIDSIAGPGGYPIDAICVYVYGSGLHADRLIAQMDSPVAPKDNVVLRLTTFDVNGNQVAQRSSDLRAGSRREEAFEVDDVDLPQGRVCASFTENGVERPGACVGVYP